MILAIVGTQHLTERSKELATVLIIHEISWGKWDSIVTGDAPGIDQLTWDLCEQSGVPCDPLAPRVRRWEPMGFKARNIRICETADEMLCIRHPDPIRPTYGSGWTADYMENMGKPVTRVLIS